VRSTCRGRRGTECPAGYGRLLSKLPLTKLHAYLLRIREEVLPKSPAAHAVRYALNEGDALTRFLQEGDLYIDNRATERANRDVAMGRANWTLLGSDEGGKTPAVLMSFVATCKGCWAEPFAWFRDGLSRIATHPVNRLAELLPHNGQPLGAATQA
jgi:transposase